MFSDGSYVHAPNASYCLQLKDQEYAYIHARAFEGTQEKSLARFAPSTSKSTLRYVRANAVVKSYETCSLAWKGRGEIPGEPFRASQPSRH